MGGFRYRDGNNAFPRDATGGIDFPSYKLEYIPDMSEADIEDRSKAGMLAKSLLIWQLFVFLANCAARWHQALPLSLLEITTIGHSLCSLITMVLWWYKPHSLCEATLIDRARFPRYTMLDRRPPLAVGRSKVLPGALQLQVPHAVTTIAIAALYGLPHILGLSAPFPTHVEKWCWQIATCAVIGSPLAMCFVYLAVTKLRRLQGSTLLTLGMLLRVLLVIYPACSMFLVGESLRQVFALTKSSFDEPQLTRYLPRFS